MTFEKLGLPAEEPLGELEPVAHFDGAMPTGVTVSQRRKPYTLFRVRIDAGPVLLR